jgi:hypothetical protein
MAAPGGHLAISKREDMQPLVLATLPATPCDITPESVNKDPIVYGVELARFEARNLQCFSHDAEKVSDALHAAMDTGHRHVFDAPHHVPRDFRRKAVQDRGDVAMTEGGVEALDEFDVSVIHVLLLSKRHLCREEIAMRRR